METGDIFNAANEEARPQQFYERIGQEGCEEAPLWFHQAMDNAGREIADAVDRIVLDVHKESA